MKNLIQEWRRLKFGVASGNVRSDETRRYMTTLIRNRLNPHRPDRPDRPTFGFGGFERWADKLRILRNLDYPFAEVVTLSGPARDDVGRAIPLDDAVGMFRLAALMYPDIARESLPSLNQGLRPDRLLYSSEGMCFLKRIGLAWSPGLRQYGKLCDMVEHEGEMVPKSALVRTRRGDRLRKQCYPFKASSLPYRFQRLHPKDIWTSNGVVYMEYQDFREVPDNFTVYDHDSEIYTYKSEKPKPFEIRGLGGHGSSAQRLTYVLPNGTGARMGYEWEMCVDGQRKPSAVGAAVAKMMNEVAQANYTLVERDSSISSGFELVTASTRLSSHREVLMKLHRKTKGRGFRTNPYARCLLAPPQAGTHVHIARKDVPNPAAMAYFLERELPDYRPSPIVFKASWASDHLRRAFYMEIVGRSPNRYCYPTDVEFHEEEHGRHKFLPFNTQHKNTYELRIFGPTNDPLRILSYLEFTQALADWTANFVGVPKKRITVRKFMVFIAENADKYPVLVERVVHIGGLV